MMRRSIFVTGAASGIGRETARLFAQRRWFVGLFDLNDNTLAALASEFGAEHCCWQKLDVTRLTGLQTQLGLSSLFAVAIDAPAVVGRPSQKMECISQTNSHPYRLRQ